MNTYWLKGLSPNERLYENIIQHPVGMKNNNKNIMRYMAQEKKEGKETTTTKKQNSPVVSKYFRSNDAVCVWIPLIFFTLRFLHTKKKKNQGRHIKNGSFPGTVVSDFHSL